MPNDGLTSTPPETAAETEKPSEETHPSEKPTEKPLDDLVPEIKKGYEEKIAKLKSDYEKKLKDRDDVIKQLLTGETIKTQTTIADEINERREKELKW